MIPEKLFHYRLFANNLLHYACNGQLGRDELDKVYQTIVENRDGPTPEMRRKYSSCGDLAHWLYARLGCLLASFMNRDEEPGDGGELDWKSGVNLNRWVGYPIGVNPYSIRPRADYPLSEEDCFAAGDIIVIDNIFGGHVLCVTHYIPKLQVIHTAEYGKPGGKLGQHDIGIGAKGLFLDSKNPILAHTRMVTILDGEEKAGRLGPPDVDVLNGYQALEAILALKNGMLK